MATSVTLNGTSYDIPALNEDNWGDEVSNYLIALSTGVLQKAGGSFTLTAEIDFGATYGIKSAYFTSRGTAASAGIVRLANTEVISWRNAANSADIDLTVNGSDLLTYNSNELADFGTVTKTEYGYLSGVTSAIQTQFAGKAPTSHTHDASDIVSGTLADARLAESSVTQHEAALSITAPQIDANVSNTEFSYLDGVTSSIQNQINSLSAGSGLSTDLSAGSVNILVGASLIHPFLIVDTGDTYTVTGQLVCPGKLTINGTVTVTSGGTTLIN